jgi:glycosyltransferase involved in cell wall biosynthesis
MKKVLHLTHTDIRSDSRVLKEMQALSFSEYKVYGIGVSEYLDGSKHSEMIDELLVFSINLYSRKFKLLPKIIRHILSLFEFTFKVIFSAVKLRADIIHCHDTLVLPVGVFLKLLTRAKVIYDAHELESDRNGLTKIQGKLTIFVERFLWSFIDALIVVSPSIELWYKENVGKKKSSVILNSPVYDVSKKKKENSYLREKFSIPLGSKIFIYVGILGEGRGIDLLLEVFMREDISSSLVFLGYGEMANKIRKVAEDNNNVFIHDSVSHEKVVPLVASADYGLCLVQNVSLSDYFCLPNKLFEYCFAGVPVLASDFPDIRDLVEKYDIGRCCALNVEHISEMIELMQSQDYVFNNNFADIKELSWQNQEKKLIALYESL